MKLKHKQVLLMPLLMVAYCRGDEDKYTTKYDSVNFQEIITSDRLLRNYINCLLDQGTCTPDALELKKVLPETLENDCLKCSETQKSGVYSVIKHLVKNRAQWWHELEAKYDPEGKYWPKLKESIFPN